MVIVDPVKVLFVERFAGAASTLVAVPIFKIFLGGDEADGASDRFRSWVAPMRLGDLGVLGVAGLERVPCIRYWQSGER